MKKLFAILVVIACGAASAAEIDTAALLTRYVNGFNATDPEPYTNAIPNSAAMEFLRKNAPRFACPDADIERTYYFRWWTFRKHFHHELGLWTVSEFVPAVGWSGPGNTIVCPAGHHFLECRWLRDPQYVNDLSKFWLSDKRSEGHRYNYTSWLYTGVKAAADVTGNDALADALLDDAIGYYSAWVKGWNKQFFDFDINGENHRHMGGDGKGAFVSIDDCEGTELSLGGHGWKPLVNSAMWSEANTIAEVASRTGRGGIAAEYAAKAERNAKRFKELCWNEKANFFYTVASNGVQVEVRELHGYAPWYFGVPVGVKPDFAQLTDPQGFYGKLGLTFPERRAKGFTISYEGHSCQWNGPSWPFATSIALTAYANYLHSTSASSSDFTLLLHQYAAQQKLGDLPWIDENCNPDKPDWIARTMRIKYGRRWPPERGKDYNHSTFCDLVISGLVGIVPKGARGFDVDPLFPGDWEYCVLENLRYRGHDVAVRWQRGKGLSVELDGRQVVRRDDLGKLEVKL